MDLKKEIENLLVKPKEEKEVKEVVFEVGAGCSEMHQINEALKKADDVHKLALTVNLLNLWFKAGYEKEQEEALHIFGKHFEINGAKRLFFTLTANRRQLRVWYGAPACIEANYVDSCGKNLLLGVYGNPKFVQEYLDVFLKIIRFAPIEVPNGAKLYMRWE